jgi:protein-S-isoprenylcysteine O-methyltransferase Ste14
MAENASGLPSKPEDSVEAQPGKKATAADIRKAAYFVLVIAAIFVINAMETGSYRTPWPVAAGVTLVGCGLLAYSFVKARREKTGG